MSRERFVIADTHFSQPSMCAFGDEKGPLRPWGRYLPEWKELSKEAKADLMPEYEERAREMDEAMVDRWNKIVPATGATVYHLGDVTMKMKYLPILDRLHGKKKLIPGNHEIFPAEVYLKYFYDIAAYRIGDGIIMSHIPVHEGSIKDRWKANVHGHLHAGRVMMENPDYTYWRHQWGSGDMEGDIGPTPQIINPRYLCVSVERIGFTPLPWDEMMDRINKQQS